MGLLNGTLQERLILLKRTAAQCFKRKGLEKQTATDDSLIRHFCQLFFEVELRDKIAIFITGTIRILTNY